MSFSFVPLLTAQQHYTAVLYNVKSIILHYFYISFKFEVLLCVIGFLLSYSEDIPPIIITTNTTGTLGSTMVLNSWTLFSFYLSAVIL